MSVIMEHAEFTLARALAFESHQKKCCDKCDQQNANNAQKFLINLLKDKLQKQMHKTCQEEDSFVDCWMELMLLIHPVSIEQHEHSSMSTSKTGSKVEASRAVQEKSSKTWQVTFCWTGKNWTMHECATTI